MTRTKTIIGALAVASAVAVSGCGSSSSSAAKSGSGAGAPIRLMVDGLMTPAASFNGLSFPYAANGAMAAAAAINATGGINGHKIEIEVCDSHGDPNGSAQCGRTAVEHKDIAVVATFDPLGAPQLLGVLQAAGIPYIGGLPSTVAELSSPVSFQFDPGPNLSATALTKLWVDSGCKNVAAILPAVPGNDVTSAQQAALAKSFGVKVSTQLVKPGILDVTPSLSTALAGKPDCFTYAGDGQTFVKYIFGARKLGYKGQFISSAGSLVPQFLAVLGAVGDGIRVINATLSPTSNDPTVTEFRNQLTSYYHGNKGSVLTNSNEFGQDGWSSIQLVKQALTGATDQTSSYLLKKIPTMCDVNVGNVYPHIDFCKPVATNKTLTRVYNDSWQYFVAKGGHYLPTDSAWHNLVSTFPKS